MKLKLLPILLGVLLLGACGPEEEPLPEDVEGCTDETSLTYNAEANVDDGSCIYAENKQRSLFVKFTGTWCWACGDYGAGVVKSMKETHGDDIVTIEIHKGSDPMNNAIADAWTQHWSHSATPSFIANSTLLSGHPVRPGNEIINAHNLNAPAVLLHNEFTSTGATIAGKAYIQADQDLSGEYSLGIYIIGQDYVYKQIADDGSVHPEWEFDEDSRTYPEYHHEDIMHGEVNNSAFGQTVFSGDVSANTVETIEYSFDHSSEWAPEIDVVLIAWMKEGTTYKFVNAVHYDQE